jgi:serine-type D-Ala-D-Ala carboxypeptidase/endopeptidase (penicillin-binding protein 4)
VCYSKFSDEDGMKVYERWKLASRMGSAALAVTACAQPAPQAPQPRISPFLATVDSVINTQVNNTHWGVEVFDHTNNQLIYGYNSTRQFIPASNTKLVVSAVAMGKLGPEFRYQTPIFVAGAPGDTAPRGLLIVGQGDPTMSGRFNGGDDFAVVKMLADSMYAKGIRRISGDIVVDASFFTPERVHSTWEIGDLPWYYAAPTSAFAIAEGALRLIVRAGAAAGAPPTVSVVGANVPLPVVMRAMTDTIGAGVSVDVDYEAWPDTLVITGRLGANRADSSWIAIPDQATFAAQSLREALMRRGITTTGAVRIARDTAAAREMRAAFVNTRPLVTWTSPPIKEIIAGILKPSQNWIAEQVLRTLGARFGNEGSWASGIRVERRYLIDVARVDSTGFALRDGSGLSAQNLLSPRATLQLLEHARQASWGADFRAALPAPGMRGGTLSSRLPGLETRLAAKTGTIANVNSLSGYLRTADNRDLTFAIYTNGSGRSSAEVRRAIDRIVNAMAQERLAQ